jgi:MCM P-loop domain
MPTPYTGWKALRAGLIADTYLEATYVFRHKKSYSDYELTDEVTQQIVQLSREPQIYDKLAKSIAPEIFGMVDVKKVCVCMCVCVCVCSVPSVIGLLGVVSLLCVCTCMYVLFLFLFLFFFCICTCVHAPTHVHVW